MSKAASRAAAPTVPAARIEFEPEDRKWIVDRIDEMLASGQLTLGPHGASLEAGFASLCGVPHAVAVNSGTSALEIILRTLDIAGKDVLVPANTFFATAAAVVHAGGTPVLMDTDPETLGTHPDEIERRRTPNTVGVVVVHVGGIVSPRMKEIQELSNRMGLWLVEDAAHAHGSSFGGTAAGAFGVAAAFSFYPTKVMTAGEGGIITTSDDRTSPRKRESTATRGRPASHRTPIPEWATTGACPSPMPCHRPAPPRTTPGDDREAPADRADLRCGPRRLHEPHAALRPPETTPVLQLLQVHRRYPKERLDRKALKAKLREDWGVSLAGEVYEDPIQRQPIFERYAALPLPVSEDACARHICLPLFPSMTDEQAARVIEALQATIG